MRATLFIVSSLLLLFCGCQQPSQLVQKRLPGGDVAGWTSEPMLLLNAHRSNHESDVAGWLAHPITPVDARALAVAEVDQSIERIRQRLPNASKPEAEGLQTTLRYQVQKRQNTVSALEAFLDELQPGDELWLYDSRVPPRKDGRIGFAIRRAGWVVGDFLAQTVS